MVLCKETKVGRCAHERSEVNHTLETKASYKWELSGIRLRSCVLIASRSRILSLQTSFETFHPT